MNIISVILRKLFNLPIRLRCAFYEHFNLLMMRANNVTFGQSPKITGRFYIRNKGICVIGDHFIVSSGESINPISRNIRGSFCINGGGEFLVGDNVGMSSPCIWVEEKVTIGNNVKIGANTVIIDNDAHSIDYRERCNIPENKRSMQKGEIIIEDNVLIGMNCMILKNVRIGARTVIGAGSVVTKSIPSDCIAAGNPCKVIRRITF